MKQVSRKFWPYDEVTLERDLASADRVHVKAPWLQFSVRISPEHLTQTQEIVDRLKSGDVTPQDIPKMSWFFSSLSKYPLAYILPRQGTFGTDEFSSVAPELPTESPKNLMQKIASQSEHSATLDAFAGRVLKSDWTWDQDAALEFSNTGAGYDPESLYSIARRFHLLNDLENNVTGPLIDYVRSLKNQTEKFRKASAVIVRQNHYITEKCDVTLRAALPSAQGAEEEILEFIQAEAGHDKILLKALKSLGTTPESVPTLDATISIMDVFRYVGKRNLLAFAMVVDIFERTSYDEQDPMAAVLIEGGESTAGAQMDTHREINDAGEHENVALGFLQTMKPVSEAYAREALFLAELATLVIHQLSADTLELLKSESFQ
jgi:hypothetical protein